MTLIKCPTCGRGVSTNAISCPGCGEPIKEFFDKNNESLIPKEPSPSNQQETPNPSTTATNKKLEGIEDPAQKASEAINPTDPDHFISQDKTNESTAPVNPELVGIGGWLVFPAISLVVGPLAVGYYFIKLLKLFSAVFKAGFGGSYALILFLEAGLLAFMIYVSTCFFRKKRNTPFVITILMIASLVFLGLVIIINESLGVGDHDYTQIVSSGISSIIWISYFWKSKRVKATFVK
jgi:hypothetical protein